MSVNLEGKTAIVTGGSRGLGAAIVRALESAGANVMAPPRSAADLREAGAPGEIMQWARAMFDHLDILVNNAAIQGPVAPAIDGPQLGWDTTLQVNLVAPCFLTMKALAWMRQTGAKGSIINISGGGATSPRPNYSAYATAKCGLVRFSETVAEEVRPLGIRVNCVAPGKLNCGMGGPDGDDPKNAAELVAWLASDESAHITGKLISAKWDPWRNGLPALTQDEYTLRRIA